MPTLFQRAIARFEKRFGSYDGSAQLFGIRLQAPDGSLQSVGRGVPRCTFACRDARGLEALTTMDQLLIGEAYLRGHIDIEGDLETVLTHRDFFPDLHPLLRAWQFLKPRITGQVRSDHGWIAQHYDQEPDFFLLFLDRAHRCYSHAVYESADETLEDAMSRKLAFALDAIGVKPGDRVLDIGGGWGAFTEYGGCRGIRVTSLTISRQSERFLLDLIERERLPCTVAFEHLWEHSPAEPYDAIVNLGVTEHLPDYDRSLAKYRALLKPGGRVYLDASATRKKFDVSSFLQRHIFPGNGSPMCLHDYLRAVAASPFEVEGVWNDRRSYELTTREWARRLDANREEIERRWGTALYRKFRLYLWGSADGMRRDALQAYRVLLTLPPRSA